MLTLLDLAKRTNSDPVIGLIEETLTHAPELITLPTRPVPGTIFKATLRDSLPTGGFRGANEGIDLSSSQYRQKEVNLYFFDSQMQVDEAIVKGDSREIGDILSDEAHGAVEGALIKLGKQIYYGTDADANGFSGFRANVDPSMIVDAKGTGLNTTSAWFVFENVQGVHAPVGNQGAINMLDEWLFQQVSDPRNANKKLMAYINNLSFYIGLSFGSKYSVGCIKNITTAKPLTDALGAEMLAKFPIGRTPTRCFLNRDAAYLLQLSRSSIGNQVAGKDGRGAFSPMPEEIQGIPIQRTDSITSTEEAW